MFNVLLFLDLKYGQREVLGNIKLLMTHFSQNFLKNKKF